jgi:glycosyltransferase involved in cell wall biosynthesis
LRVAHAPSVASTKGTALIAPVLSKLEALGVIEYRQITGIPSAQMPEVYWNADVVLDQFRVGSYGVGACEAMAAGCVVVGHVMDDVRDIVGDTTGQRLPVVEATPDTLEAVLRALAEDGESLRNSRSAGIGFVRQVHDGRLSSSVLTKTWLH